MASKTVSAAVEICTTSQHHFTRSQEQYHEFSDPYTCHVDIWLSGNHRSYPSRYALKVLIKI